MQKGRFPHERCGNLSFCVHRRDGFAAGERSCWRLAARKALLLRRVTPTLWNRHPAPRIPDKGCLRLYNLEELFDIEGKFIINKEEGENRALLISATGVGIIIQTGHENDNDEAS